MPLIAWRGATTALAAPALIACGGLIAQPSPDDDASRSGIAGGAGSSGGGVSAGPTPGAIPAIPTGPPRAPGAVGTTPCSPLAQPTTIRKTTGTTPLIIGQSWNSMVYVIDRDPERPGRHRAFIERALVLERHALSEDDAMPGTFIIDRGLPNQIVLTKTSLQGAGADGPLTTVLPDKIAILAGFAKDSPESLAYADAPTSNWWAADNVLFVLGPVADGVLGVPRVFYGPVSAIKERAFLGFAPSDSSAAATAATAVTFDFDGAPTTLPTVVTRETAGLINGFSSGLSFLCF